MSIFLTEHIFLVAIVGGVISATSITGIGDLLSVAIDKETWKIRETLSKCLIASCTSGLLLSVIYYAFAMYGFPESNMTPVQIIVLFTCCFGLGFPLLDVILKLVNRKLLA